MTVEVKEQPVRGADKRHLSRAARVLGVAAAAGAMAAGIAVSGAALLALSASTTTVQEISSDPYTNSTSQHRTEVEPDVFSFGNTVVAAFQAGRFFSGGASSNIGWATSADGGVSWTSGFLPGLTIFSTPAGQPGRATDPSVSFDSKLGIWLITSLICAPPPDTCNSAATPVVVSRSADGVTWSLPVTVSTGDNDKEWITCDNGSASPFFGRCYISWNDIGNGRTLTVASNDGGITWGTAVSAIQMSGVQPVVQPDGTLIIVGVAGSSIVAIRSTNGGVTYGSAVAVASVQSHTPTGMRAPVLPSVAMDGAGKVFVAWPDCRFRSGCSANDIVMSTSADGVTWPVAPTRVPIDSAASGVDHFIPGLGIDPSTAGASAHLGLSYYYFPIASCTVDTCQLDVGFVSSDNGGAAWSVPMQLNAQPMNLSWLANTNWPGRMVGDYIATVSVSGGFLPVFALAAAPTGATFNEWIAAAVIGTGSPTASASPTATPTPSPTLTPAPTPTCPNGAVPPWPIPADDPDCDGFSTAAENFIGTLPLTPCAATPAQNDEPPPAAWPVDLNDDRKATTQDVLRYIPVLNTTAPGPPYSARFDLNMDGGITTQDVIQFIPFLNKSCAP